MTPKQQLWQRYYDAIKKGQQKAADQILIQLHQSPPTQRGQGGGCSKCRKYFR